MCTQCQETTIKEIISADIVRKKNVSFNKDQKPILIIIVTSSLLLLFKAI